MTTVSDTEKRYRRFYDYVLEQILRTKWVSKENEAQWLQMATFDLNIEPFATRALVLGAAATQCVFVESEMERLLDDLVKKTANRSKSLKKADFVNLADMLQVLSRGALNKDHAEQLVKEAVIRNDITPRGSGLFRSRGWFRSMGLHKIRA